MGLDLTLLPLRDPRDLYGTHIFCGDSLRFDRDDQIFGQIITGIPGVKVTIETQLIPPQLFVESYYDGGIRRSKKDVHGNKFSFAYAEDLRNLKMLANASPKNLAIKAFIDALPDDAPIILFWS